MTCVAGLVHGGKVYLAGDSARTGQNDQMMVCRDPKVFRLGDMVLGCAGSPRFMQLVHHAFAPPPLHDYIDRDGLDAYMAIDFVNALKACLGEEAPKDDNPSNLMVGIKGRLFVIYSDFQVEEAISPYSAIGGSCDLALGSLYSTMIFLENDPHRRLCFALQAAREHNAAVREPFIYVHTP